MGVPWPAVVAGGTALVAGGISYLGGRKANKDRAAEAKLNRKFQLKMRNTQWQASIADMEKAGINPALAYSQGPNAAPGGNMAQQMDAISPAISSAMQMRRMRADLKQIKASTEKATQEARIAGNVADLSKAKNVAYGMEKTNTGSMRMDINPDTGFSLLGREIRAGISNIEARTRREGLTSDVMAPMAQLSKQLGTMLPILALISGSGAVGGGIKAGSRALKARALRKRLAGSRR